MPISISYGIVAHPDRKEWATNLASQVNGLISLDEDNLGCGRNHLRTWQLAYDQDVTASHVCVLEDDAEPVENFLEVASLAVQRAPAGVVSWYLGTGRPPGFQLRTPRRLAQLDRIDGSWLGAGLVYHAVALCIRRTLVPRILDWCEQFPDEAPDGRLSRWCRGPGRQLVLYSVPSIVDHRDGPSLAGGSPGGGDRVAWRFGDRIKPWNDRWLPL